MPTSESGITVEVTLHLNNSLF